MNKETTIDIFIRNFVIKDRRERSRWELEKAKTRGNFSDRLNHHWDSLLDAKYMQRIDGPNEFEFARKELGLKDESLCYVISKYDDIDDRLMPFREAFDRAYGRGFSSLIVTVEGNKFFLETEVGNGRPYRFIGKRDMPT